MNWLLNNVILKNFEIYNSIVYCSVLNEAFLRHFRRELLLWLISMY